MPLAAHAAMGSATASAIRPDHSASDQARQRIVRSSLDHAAQDEFHRRHLEDKQENEQREQLCEDFAGQGQPAPNKVRKLAGSASSRPWEFRIDSRLRALS